MTHAAENARDIPAYGKGRKYREAVIRTDPSPVTIENVVNVPEQPPPSIEVHVDMTPVANVLAENTEMLRQLVAILSKRGAPVVNVASVKQSPPIVNVEMAKPSLSRTRVIRDKTGNMVETITEYEY